MGGALKKGHSIDGLPVIGIDETVHDLPAHEDPPDEPSPCHHDPVIPEPQKVLCEDDIIGVRASIVYENSLRQLATFLILPVDKSTGLLRTGAPCNSVRSTSPPGAQQLLSNVAVCIFCPPIFCCLATTTQRLPSCSSS